MKKELLELSMEQCPVDELLKYVRGHKCGECGKCVFGYEGAAQLELTLSDITQKKSRPTDLEQLTGLCGFMKEQSMCEDGAELADTALAVFEKYREDFVGHINKKSCKAGVCRKFVTFHILVDKCTGCGDCMDECEDDAILGKNRFVHVIVQDECTKCGKCQEVCDEDAVVVAGAVKPRCPLKPIPCKR